MKFLCDRCKTRYSIGDDRVRGKILKIRCKNCSNVITVREGMPEPVAAVEGPESAARRATPTLDVMPGTAAIESTTGIGEGPAPAALQDEWYVSIEGEQSGPFSLAAAQQWITSKPPEADLHCWNEGFDDWLPVDKVSHFRGLRTRPVLPPARPPVPRTGSGGHRAITTPPPIPEEPRPLFAATMAAIEKSAGTSAPSAHGPASAPAFTPASRPVVTPAATPASGAAASAHRGPTKQGGGSAPSFDFGGADLAPAPGAVAPAYFGAPVTATATATPTFDHDDDDDLDIGEVSRVVNLADLMRASPKPRTSSQAAPRATAQSAGAPPRHGGGTQRISGPLPSMAGAGAPMRGFDGAGIDRLALGHDDLPIPDEQAPGATMAAHAPPVSHRRGMIALLVGAAALLGAAIIVVPIVLNSQQGTIGDQLGGATQIDTTRPDDPRRNFPGLGAGSGYVVTANPFNPNKPIITKRPVQPVIPTRPNPPVGGDSLRGDEIETMAKTNSSLTQRCYMRSQRGADAITIGDVKKVMVTLTVDSGGRVSDVSLSDHGNDTLGKCLSSAMRGWKFRTSPGGTFKFSLVFAGQ